MHGIGEFDTCKKSSQRMRKGGCNPEGPSLRAQVKGLGFRVEGVGIEDRVAWHGLFRSKKLHIVHKP